MSFAIRTESPFRFDPYGVRFQIYLRWDTTCESKSIQRRGWIVQSPECDSRDIRDRRPFPQLPCRRLLQPIGGRLDRNWKVPHSIQSSEPYYCRPHDARVGLRPGISMIHGRKVVPGADPGPFFYWRTNLVRRAVCTPKKRTGRFRERTALKYSRRTEKSRSF